MRYAPAVIKKTLSVLAVSAAVALGLAAPAHAGSTYTPEVNALVITACDAENFIIEIDGAKPGTPITGQVVFKKVSTTLSTETISDTATGTTGTGGTSKWDATYPFPAGTTRTYLTISFTRADGSAGGDSYDVSNKLYKRADCQLTVTGSNSAPIGKIALGAVLAGGLLATVAVRRRPRKASAAA